MLRLQGLFGEMLLESREVPSGDASEESAELPRPVCGEVLEGRGKKMDGWLNLPSPKASQAIGSRASDARRVDRGAAA